ncbi:carbon-nitrogen hydrolase family protein [Donghicola sp.]|jgi:predicted amidohydrolase|uniref:carbon-nitrogen hydrolase family protein n=1 Tax=Donghicola sp. TaxID=1929294 RepID=UPI0025DCEC8B|nr:carbon-nitrogen hydrolase family protein [Donghicola sp.]MCT4576654.1 carbon-nitrogen hydrolase family protein [Donghicola sp.]
MKAALLQITSSDDPAANAEMLQRRIAEAASNGADFVLTPEVSNCVSTSRDHQIAVLRHQEDDPTLARLRAAAAEHGIWLLIGSLALKTHDADGRFANRSFLINPQGDIVAQYDKIHMFDVQVSETESYRESAGYRPGDRAVLAETPFGIVGLTICYDVRFPHLYRDLAKAGAGIICVPAAFSPVTGAAHWETLLRARAIECGAYVLAPAQCGTHPSSGAKARSTYGHSLAVDPWGKIVASAGDLPTITYVELCLKEVAESRARIFALDHDRPYSGPLD